MIGQERERSLQVVQAKKGKVHLETSKHRHTGERWSSQGLSSHIRYRHGQAVHPQWQLIVSILGLFAVTRGGDTDKRVQGSRYHLLARLTPALVSSCQFRDCVSAISAQYALTYRHPNHINAA